MPGARVSSARFAAYVASCRATTSARISSIPRATRPGSHFLSAPTKAWALYVARRTARGAASGCSAMRRSSAVGLDDRILLAHEQDAAQAEAEERESQRHDHGRRD